MGDETQQPSTQQTRDIMARSDHDTIIELRTLMTTILQEIKNINDRLKEAITDQGIAAGILDGRIRKLEDQSTLYLPEHATFKEQIKGLQTNVDGLQNNRFMVVGGWKTLVVIGAIVIGLVTLFVGLDKIFNPHPPVTVRQTVSSPPGTCCAIIVTPTPTP